MWYESQKEAGVGRYKARQGRGRRKSTRPSVFKDDIMDLMGTGNQRSTRVSRRTREMNTPSPAEMSRKGLGKERTETAK